MGIESRVDQIEHRLSALESAVQLEDRLNAFPEPLALAIARAQSAETYGERLLAIFDAGEIAIKYSHAIGLVFANGEVARRMYSMPPSLGQYVSDVRDVLTAHSARPGKDQLLNSLSTSFYRSNGKLTSAGRFLAR